MKDEPLCRYHAVVHEVLSEIRLGILTELESQEAESHSIKRRLIIAEIALATLPQGSKWWYLHPVQSWRACYRFHRVLADTRNLTERSDTFYEWKKRLDEYLSRSKLVLTVPASTPTTEATNEIKSDAELRPASRSEVRRVIAALGQHRPSEAKALTAVRAALSAKNVPRSVVREVLRELFGPGAAGRPRSTT
jgi:hypothetical protein